MKKMRNLFPFYSKNDVKFRFLRNRILSSKDFECLVQAMIVQKKTNSGEIAKNLWMSNQDLRSLSEKGHCIGLHSYSHPYAMADLSYDEQFEEYEKNYKHIEKICGKKVVSMSHPLNSYNKDTVKILKQMGLECGFCSNMEVEGNEKTNLNVFEIGREDATNILINRQKKEQKEREYDNRHDKKD
jgi:peptidoglycan/xylan/chitin deacetylase (PgdA/CDA1 family)